MRLCRVLLCAVLLMSAPLAAQGAFQHGLLAVAAQPKPSPDEFIPLAEVPPEEQIPAFGLIGAAYGFVWVVVVGYVWSLGRRLQKAEQDIAALERKR